MKVFYLLLLGFIALVFNGCGATKLNTIQSGTLATKGVEIKFDNIDLTLKYNEVFKPNEELQAYSSYWMHLNKPQASKPCTTQRGCHSVKVNVSQMNKTFYGKLHLSKSYEGDVGPGSRSYYIQVPDKYLNEATNGRISVVYEVVKYQTGRYKHTNWVLWLSDRPF